jgi:hypothetical protein
LAELLLIVAVVMPVPANGGIEVKKSAAKMVKSLSALAIFALLGASVVALPGFAPKVEAGEVAALAKADRLEVRAAASNCSTQVWPDYDASCLRNPTSRTVVEARLVTARR